MLFGGKSGAALVGDSWLWDGENWTQVDDIGPRGRSERAMAYDRVRDRTVRFGGSIGGLTVGDTWQGMAATGAGLTHSWLLSDRIAA